MTSRERVGAVLRRERPDRVPFNFWMDRFKMDEYDRELGKDGDFRIRHYGADVTEVIPPVSWYPSLPRNVVSDTLTTWNTASAASDLAILEDLELPNPRSPEMLRPIHDARRRYPETAIFVLLLTHLDVLLDVRLIQDLSLDMYDRPLLLQRLCSRIAERIGQIAAFVCENADVDAIYLAGDLASTRGPLFGVELLQRFWLDEMRVMVQAAHSRGVPVLYHCCGRVVDLLDLFVDTGVDGINPFQASVNNARELEPYRDRLMLYGGIDNSFIIPQGPEPRIRAHIRDVFRTIGSDGGLILSSHDIQGDTPKAHIDAMVDEIKRCVY